VIKRNLIFIGYMHASVIGGHRPDIAYPDRKIRRAAKSYCDVHSEPCPCADEHVEVWVRRINGNKIRTVA
jgi:hypothetical protein